MVGLEHSVPNPVGCPPDKDEDNITLIPLKQSMTQVIECRKT